MFDWKDFERHKNILSQAGENIYHECWGQHHVDLRPRDLLRWIEFAKEDMNYLTLIEVVATDRSGMPGKWGHTLEVVYIIFSMGDHQRLHLHVHLNEGEVVPSVKRHYAHADWMEREASEMVGVRFDPACPSLILSIDEKKKPLRKSPLSSEWVPYTVPELPRLRMNPNKSEPPWPEESWVWKGLGSLASETMANFECEICFDPIKVVMARPQIGFYHRGLERTFQERPWTHIMQLMDLVQGGSSPTYACAWAKTLEEMLIIKPTERAQAIRIVMLELARIGEHLTVVADILRGMKKNECRLILNCREKIFELFEKYCGQRQGAGIVRLGGVREDLPHGWISEYQSMNRLLAKHLQTIHAALMGQMNFRSHLDTANVSAQAVLQWGIGGPAMRASGLNFDLRKSRPFYFYQDIDFDVPVGLHGTSYDRYLIRYEEIHQSLRIITQVLDNLPLGEVNVGSFAEPNELLPWLKEIKGQWHYSALESPSGEAGLALLYGDSVTPYRLKIKSPSFVITQALGEFLRGLEAGQLPAAVASLGVRRSELDR
jgi:NADH-quinone oxidoreductase subunit C/D